ncbi:DNA polymerase III subunit alpha [Candidatus Poribacteria bacterium]|nr:DNA polymerase III subunit alpha [Candidatus Poribacteria bacterium]
MEYIFIVPSTYTDEELVRHVQNRNEGAFAELMSRYSPRIWNLIVQNSRQRRDAEEILMDIWFTVWDNIIGLRKIESFGGWLRRIAFTACNRYYSANTMRNTEELLNYEDIALLIDREAEQRFNDARICADAIEAVKHLPHKVRHIAELYYLDLCSIKEISEELDIPIGTVKSRLSEIRKLLRKEFQVEPVEGGIMTDKTNYSKELRSDRSNKKIHSITNTSDKGFVHLHNHSEYSLLDGACKLQDMVRWAVENSSPALALTDHGNMFGAVEFYKTARAEGVNPIIGCEVNVKMEDSSNSLKENGISYELTLLAENNEGYHNLLELTSLGYTHGIHKKPFINMEMLREHHSGIIALTGCMNGILPKPIHSNQSEEAVRNLLTLKDIMREDHLYVEIQNHFMDQEMSVNPIMVDIAKEYNIPLVGTNDCHYLRKTDHKMHDILLCIKGKKSINDPDRLRFNNHYYFKNLEEMQHALNEYPSDAIINTLEIAERCNLRLNYDDQVMAKFDIPEGHTQSTYLRKLCYDGLHEKYGSHLSDPLRKRMDYELDVIEKTGSVDMFLIVADYVNYAIKQGHLMTARGSAASSLALYTLGVINFNPMDYGCLFERFLNPERIKTPDINIDFADNACDDVIDYIVRKYGHDSVGKIASFTTFGVKDAIKNVGHVLEISNKRIKELTDLLPGSKGFSIDEIIKRNTELQCLAELPENRELIEISRSIEGLKRDVFCHASAIVIANGPLTDNVPLFKDRKGQIAVQFGGKTVEDIGIVRFDTLGVVSLSKTADCLKLITENHNVNISLEDIPLDDIETYSLFSEGILDGIFQFDTSPEIKQYVAKLRPDNFEEFSAIITLFRPVPIHKGIFQLFIDLKHGNEPIEYIHPSVEPILKNTYGLCIYQEQVIQIVCDIAGFSLGKAEILRSALSQKDDFTINEFHTQFITGSMNNGINRDDAQRIFDYLKSDGEYAFLRSHSVAYSLLAYRMAYLKVHYPHEFMTAIMNSKIANSEKISLYKAECSRLQDFLDLEIKLLPLDINYSAKDFTIEGKGIRTGLLSINELNEETVNSIIVERNRNGIFESITDFKNRLVNKVICKDQIDLIVTSGAFEALTE